MGNILITHFAMMSEWMVNGNINEYIQTNRDANRFELVIAYSYCRSRLLLIVTDNSFS